MSEELNPKANEPVEPVAETVEPVAEDVVNYADLTLGELSQLFEGLMADQERMKRAKEAENIKTAFYKKLTKEKADVKPADTAEEAEAAKADASPKTTTSVTEETTTAED